MKPNKKIFLGMLLLLLVARGQAQTASFNFSLSSQPVTGWVNVAGDPSTAVRTGVSAGITVSSVATVNWAQYNGAAAFDGGGVGTASFFPAAVMANMWFQYSGFYAAYNAAVPQLLISGLNIDSVYTIQMSASFSSSSFDFNPTQYTVIGANVYGNVDVNVNSNTTGGAVFNNVAPDSNGDIRVYVNTAGGSNTAGISGIKIASGRSTAPVPVISLSNPLNNTIIPEDGSVLISASASESGGTIAVVEFYAGTTKIGADSSSPYSMTWNNPDEGPYTITARAIDGQGNINTASVNVSVEPLSSFWSTTGNIHMNPDSNFVGNVDSVRLAFRTKNIERMSISPTGSVGIGTIAPTAQLHITGSVRLAGIAYDSAGADSRVLVSDTTGNLSYQNATGNIGLTIGGGLGQSVTGALTIGDSIPGTGPHSFMSNRYQYLNGYMYSIGGSVNDPVNTPVFRIYNNGDLTGGTTMNRSVNTENQTGLRYYSKLGLLEIGASDRQDTTRNKIVAGIWPGSGLIINSDDSNNIRGKLLNSIFMADLAGMDSSTYIKNTLIGMEQGNLTASMGHMENSMVGGIGITIAAPVYNSNLTGGAHNFSKPISFSNITGYANFTQDTVVGILAGGGNNALGGLNQLVTGQSLATQTPAGTAIGSKNVAFATLPYPALQQGTNAPGMSGYPLFVIANSEFPSGSVSSNAVTVLYNGRTQINTTGFSQGLTQSTVTPKAALEVVSSNSGVLLPKLTNAQRNAIASADLQTGLLLYNTDSSVFQFYNGSGWSNMGARSGTGGSGWAAAGNTGTNPTGNFIGTTDSERLVFKTDGMEQMTILAGGAVGIGTSTLPQPDALLAVNGVLYAKKVMATQTGWPDYVFDKGYRLPGLEEVEHYIRRYGHLPGMIPADEVATKGVDLGESQSGLLKKVEELTLYLIDAHKKTVERQQEIDRLKAQNKSLDDHQREIDQLKEMLKKLAGN